MATKKAQSKAAPASDNSAMWKWLYVGGAVIAGLVAALNFTALDPYLTWVLILVGILVGIFFFDSDDVQNFGLRYLIILAVVAANPLGALSFGGFDIGNLINAFVGGFAVFLGPIVLTLAVRYFWNKYFGSM